MAFIPLTTVAAGQRVYASQQNLAKADLDDHEERLLVVEGATVGILTSDPGSPADDTWWVVRDGGSPQSAAVKGRIAGTTYSLAEITIGSQATHISTGGTLPTSARVGDAFYKTGASAGLYKCDVVNTWTLVGSGAGTVTNTGTLTSGKSIVGNGTADVTVSSLTAQFVGSSSGTAAAASMTTARLLGRTTASSGAVEELTAGAGLSLSGGSLALSNAAKTRAITFAIDGGGSALTTGVKADVYVPYACTLTAVTMLADQSGSVVVDIWRDSYANYPPVVGDSITASAKPTITTATKSTDSTLTGWTTSISAGDSLRFNVDSATTITRLTLTLTVTV